MSANEPTALKLSPVVIERDRSVGEPDRQGHTSDARPERAIGAGGRRCGHIGLYIGSTRLRARCTAFGSGEPDRLGQLHPQRPEHRGCFLDEADQLVVMLDEVTHHVVDLEAHHVDLVTRSRRRPRSKVRDGERQEGFLVANALGLVA